jgi:hypothetical protein
LESKELIIQKQDYLHQNPADNAIHHNPLNYLCSNAINDADLSGY